MEAEFVPIVYGTIVALVPPLVAIILALITKEVYSSIFVGILAGGVLYSLQVLCLMFISSRWMY